MSTVRWLKNGRLKLNPMRSEYCKNVRDYAALSAEDRDGKRGRDLLKTIQRQASEVGVKYNRSNLGNYYGSDR